MDSYLDIAEQILLAAKRPLTAKAILNAAYRSGIVPTHLYGKAQHKTLQARLSENILQYRKESRFFRISPGVFFLTTFLSDPAIAEKYKRPFAARRRTRDLLRQPVLAFDYRYFKSEQFSKHNDWLNLLRDAENQNALKYIDPKSNCGQFALVWAFSLVRKAESLLSYRIGRYRDDRDAFANRRTIGFPSLVDVVSHTLFSSNDYGAAESALEAVLTDLDLSRTAFVRDGTPPLPSPKGILSIEGEGALPIVLLIMEWQCPVWFEPTSRRLSLNELEWINLSVPPNNLSDFDSWSQATLHSLTL